MQKKIKKWKSVAMAVRFLFYKIKIKFIFVVEYSEYYVSKKDPVLKGENAVWPTVIGSHCTILALWYNQPIMDSSLNNAHTLRAANCDLDSSSMIALKGFSTVYSLAQNESSTLFQVSMT